jgi:hypothetical protein
MKRLRYFLLWTLMFWAFALMVGSQIAVAYGSFQAQGILHPQQDFREALKIGNRTRETRGQVSLEFVMHYWHITLGCAILFAGVGSVSGGLPGTEKRKNTAPPPLPAS